MSQSVTPPDTDLYKSLWIKQGGICALCNKPMPAKRADLAHATLWKKWRPTFDHVKARGRGGSDTADNLQLAHAICNKRKGMG